MEEYKPVLKQKPETMQLEEMLGGKGNWLENKVEVPVESCMKLGLEGNYVHEYYLANVVGQVKLYRNKLNKSNRGGK